MHQIDASFHFKRCTISSGGWPPEYNHLSLPRTPLSQPLLRPCVHPQTCGSVRSIPKTQICLLVQRLEHIPVVRNPPAVLQMTTAEESVWQGIHVTLGTSAWRLYVFTTLTSLGGREEYHRVWVIKIELVLSRNSTLSKKNNLLVNCSSVWSKDLPTKMLSTIL